MHYIKEFISLCACREEGISTPLQDLILAYDYWINRCYLGTLFSNTKIQTWKRILGNSGEIVQGIYLRDEEDWEYITKIKDSCFVYLIENTHNHYTKIGVSTNPSRRLRQLQTGNDSILQLIGTIKVEDAFKVEKLLHKSYTQKRVYGEWFAISADDLRVLSSYFIESE